MEKGVNLIGYIHAEMGLGESCRSAAKAISTTDIEFGIVDFPIGNPSRKKDLSWSHKILKNTHYNVNVFYINAPQMPLIYRHFSSKFFEGRFNIGYWHWELPDLPDEWCNHFHHLQEIWVPSTFILETVSKKSPIPVVKIPHCIQLNHSNHIKRSHFHLPENKFLFLFMYDNRSVQQRKNPEAVVDAFLTAFGCNTSSVGLVLKVNNKNYKPQLLKRLKNKIKGQENIYLVEQTLNRNKVNALIHLCDCFVSLHRSEGFGLSLAEAMYLGKPVIGTNWSGNVDFMNEFNSCPVDYKIVKVGKDFDMYKSNQLWAEPDVEQAAFLMKKLVENPQWAKTIAMRGQQTIQKEYSPEIIGEMIKSRLLGLNLL